MKPEDIAKANTEHSHQAALFCWSNQNLDKYPELKWLYAIPNGGARDRATAGRLKAEGVKSGVSDVCLPVPSLGSHGLYLELKKPGALNQESDNQKEFGAFLIENGYTYYCCDSWERARDIIVTYMNDRKHM